jgi:dTDP-4-dehydrorhamnose reductase
MSDPNGRPLELWGGIECTINRVGDQFHDQLSRSGHYDRLSDLDRIASLGVKTVRYPSLWEHVMPHDAARARWQHTDAALARMRELSVSPIVGLLHHGSGPAITHLLDPNFPQAFAAYAAAFAARYPWVVDYTPINEPLTTARFAALYGHWFPHHDNDQSFVAALLNQCRAIILAMEAIRRVAPAARLIQTEDAASTRGTAVLASQIAFENERRWLSIDVISGRVDDAHPLRDYLVANGATPAALDWFHSHAIAPDVLGLNYYITSDRYLDHRVDQYPFAAVGGNGHQRYVDVAAARVTSVGIRGHYAMLEQAWTRYHTTMAVTEAHLGCTREQQMRWLVDAWRGAQAARTSRMDVRAVTTWAMLGSWDWDSLVTTAAGHYEPGAFDIRGTEPRPTAIARVVADLAAGGEPAHPVLNGTGWWVTPTKTAAPSSARPLLITGSRGTLARAFVDTCAARGLACIPLSHQDLDISDPSAVRAAVHAWQPWAIVNTAGYVKVDQAESHSSACRRANAVGPAVLAAVSRCHRIPLLTFSSDLVFDGTGSRPYVESDVVGPQNIYGRTKAEAERRVLALHPAALVVRTSAFFGCDPHNFLAHALESLRAGRPFRAAADITVSPTYVPDLVTASLDLLIDGERGIWHLANAGCTTWAAFAASAVRGFGLDEDLIVACDSNALALAATRPRFSVLTSERAVLLPSLDDALDRYVREIENRGVVAA